MKEDETKNCSRVRWRGRKKKRETSGVKEENITQIIVNKRRKEEEKRTRRRKTRRDTRGSWRGRNNGGKLESRRRTKIT